MPPTYPGSLEEDVYLEPSTTRSGVTFRPPEIPRVKTNQPAIPPGNDSLELGGPNESQYPVSETSQPASRHSSPDPGSGTCGSEYGSASGSSPPKSEDQTLQTSQHDVRPQQALGTSPTQPPQPGLSSTPNQSLGSAVSRDQVTSEQVSSPTTQGQLKYSPLVEDEISLSPYNSRNLRDRPANYSDSEWQEHLDHLEAIDLAKHEWVNYQSGLNTSAGSTRGSNSQSLPASPHNEPETRQYAPLEFKDD